MAPDPGRVVTGAAPIRQALGAYPALNPKITVETRKIIQAGDIAVR